MEAGVDAKAAALCQQDIDIGTDVGIGTDIGTDVDIDKVDKVDGQKTRMTIFASSPFTDTKLERRVLTCNILPKLQEKGRSAAGIVVTMYDMRYGVKDESQEAFGVGDVSQ